MNVLLSSAGRRGALVQLIRDTVRPDEGRVFAVDAAPWSPACRLADGWQLVPRFDDARFFDSVVGFCKQHNIGLIIPTHDLELPVYARLQPLLAELGIRVAISGPRTVALATDKLATIRFLQHHQLPTPECFEITAATNLQALPYPLIVKPRRGSCSQGVQRVDDAEALAFYWKRTKQPLVQRLAAGQEYTVNFYVDRQRQCVAAVPHLRVETRGGEVTKCVTRRLPVLLHLAERLARHLPDAHGPLCFQAFVDPRGEARIIEINARLGGGYPIAHRAGANFIRLLIDELQGRPLARRLDHWTDGLVMTRWDDAVFTTAQEVGLN